VSIAGSKIQVEGPKGKADLNVHPRIQAKVEGNEIIVTRPSDEKADRSLHGLTRSMISNLLTGLHQGFEKDLEIQGVGFKAEAKGETLKISLGFSHPIEYRLPEGVKVETKVPTKVKVMGASKQLVGQVASEIRRYYEAEPYKGKGVRYVGEQVRRKQGKSVG